MPPRCLHPASILRTRTCVRVHVEVLLSALQSVTPPPRTLTLSICRCVCALLRLRLPDAERKSMHVLSVRP